MNEREHPQIQEIRGHHRILRLGARLGFLVWTIAVAVWFIGADEENIMLGFGQTPAVASDDHDDSVVAWETADAQVVIQALRMGVTLGTPIRISSTDAAQANAAAAHLVDSEFVVAWEEEGDEGTGILARRVLVEDSPLVPGMGVTLGTPIRITQTGRFPAVDADADGNFVVAWAAPIAGHGGRSDLHRHFALQVSRMGVTLGTPIQLSGLTGPTPPDVARRPDGDALVVWEDSKDISGAVVDADGDVVDHIRVNQLRLGRQSSPAVTVPLGGDFIVVWERNVLGLRFVVGRRIGDDGSALGNEFLVSPSVSTASTRPDVAADAWGRAFVTWTARSGHNAQSSILGREIDPYTGSPVGDEYVIVLQNAVVSSVDRSGSADDFVVIWESEEGNPSHSIAGRFLQLQFPGE